MFRLVLEDGNHIPAVPPHLTCLVLSKTRTTTVCVRPCNKYVGLRQRWTKMPARAYYRGVKNCSTYMCYRSSSGDWRREHNVGCSTNHLCLWGDNWHCPSMLAFQETIQKKNRSIDLPIQVCWKSQMNPKQFRVEGSFEHHRYVAVDAIPHTPKLGIVYRLLLRVVMCFCNDEVLLVGPRTVFQFQY